IVLRSFFFSSRRRHTRFSRDWSSDVCSSDLAGGERAAAGRQARDLAEVERELERVGRRNTTSLNGHAVVRGADQVTLAVERDQRSEERRVGKGWRCLRTAGGQ